MRESRKIVYLFILILGSLAFSYYVSLYSFLSSILGLTSLYFLSPILKDFLFERSKIRKEKKIEKLEKELEDLKTEVI
jgi:hypothetical protein